MPRSFGLVDTKISEAEYFLNRILHDDATFFGVQCDAVAFVSSARSVTFAMQASLRGMPEFDEWYNRKREVLRAEPLARFFHEFRRISQHIGENFVVGGASRNGKTVYLFGSSPDLRGVPDLDVGSACTVYFKLLLELVYDCYVEFAPLVNGQWYFTREHFASRGKSIEDAEQELGLPRGWTSVPDFGDQVRWKHLRKEADSCNIQNQFTNWLNKRLPHPDDETESEV